MKTPPSFELLTRALKRLPGVGPKTAQRYALHLLQRDREAARDLAAGLTDALARVRQCTRCNTFTEAEFCDICASPRRDPAVLCIVESPADQLVIEQTLSFSGLYFVLMGRLSPLDGIGPREIHFERLIERVADGLVKEVILATNFTQEGEARTLSADASEPTPCIAQSYACSSSLSTRNTSST